MSNKLREMFDKPEYLERVTFDNVEKYKSFLEAVNTAINKRVPVNVDGISGIKVYVKNKDSQYLIDNHETITNVVVFPDKSSRDQSIEMPIDTDAGSRTLKFLRREQENEVVLENTEGKGALYRITYNKTEKTIVVHYESSYYQAKTMEEIIDYYNSLYYFTKKIFRTDHKNKDVDTILNRFLSSILYFTRLKELSSLLGVSITPQCIDKIEDDDYFIERLYFSLVEKKPIRVNQKVTSMNGVHFPNDKRPGDALMTVTCLEQFSGKLLDKEFDLYSVNMAFNLKIDKEEKIDDQYSKVYFKEDEKQPMYVVSKFFLEEEMAKKELEDSLDNKTPYIEAKTLYEYIKSSHDEVADIK